MLGLGLGQQSYTHDWDLVKLVLGSDVYIAFAMMYMYTHSAASSNSNPVCQSHTGLHDRPIEDSTHELAKLSSLFSASRKCLKLQNWYQNVLLCL